ncbi:MAG: LpqB family beta-propeller domain-containing protein [Corynebacterium sp.]|nr:LpqB family beta-propeller domain-containing protein [Corynebacterium sp.]
MRRIVSLSMAALLLSTVTACTSLPSESEPVALRTLDDGTSEGELSPAADLEPDLVAREFYEATAVPTQRYAYARSYLTEDAASKWNPPNELLILDNVDVNFREATDVQRIYSVQGIIVGVVSSNGAYQVTNQNYAVDMTLTQVDGQWRIMDLPDQIVVERSQFRARYDAHAVYFFDTLGTQLVGDRRWFFNSTDRLSSDLAAMVLRGPSDSLAPAINFDLPSNANFVGFTDGVYRFTGLTELDAERTNRLAAQLVWTLSLSGISGPYVLDFDGGHVPSPIDGDDELTVEDFVQYNPQSSSAYASNLYAVHDGAVFRRRGNAYGPAYEVEIPGFVQDMAVSGARNRALLVSQMPGEEQVLYGVSSDFVVREYLRAASISKPSYEASGYGAWIVVDGQNVVRLSQQEGETELSFQDVIIEGLPEDHAPITQLQISPSRARLAFIMDGKLYVGTIASPTPNEIRVVNIHQVLPALEDRLTALSWQSEMSIVVGTANVEAPVRVIAVDGSNTNQLSNSNLNGPVTAIAANSSTIYVTDSRGSYEIPADSTSDSDFWREVSGLEGTKAMVIVPE